MNRQTIQEVKAQATRRFLTLPGVVSVGIGQDSSGQSIIVIGLEKNCQVTNQLPTILAGYLVQTIIVGTIKRREKNPGGFVGGKLDPV